LYGVLERTRTNEPKMRENLLLRNLKLDDTGVARTLGFLSKSGRL
jgi:hypothetical protein